MKIKKKFKVLLNMKVNGSKIKQMVKVNFMDQKVKFMKEAGKTIWKKEKESLYLKMVQFIKEIGRMIFKMDMASFTSMIWINMKVIGKMVIKMEMENTIVNKMIKILPTMVNMKMDKKKDKEH